MYIQQNYFLIVIFMYQELITDKSGGVFFNILMQILINLIWTNKLLSSCIVLFRTSCDRDRMMNKWYLIRLAEVEYL